jgi:hypothetical protein
MSALGIAIVDDMFGRYLWHADLQAAQSVVVEYQVWRVAV